MPSLYVVATPIGNLEDITMRAIRILKEVKLIAAEDTRKTRQLLSAYKINTPTTSYHEHNKLTKLNYILDCLKNKDIALVSDAGMPGISDPGFELISAAYQNNIPVIPIPGPSVLLTALTVSGLPTDSFLFLGFLPHKGVDRRRLFKSAFADHRTSVFFESPHRIPACLEDMLSIFGDRKIAVCRELTKVHEEVFRGTISQAIEHFNEPKGEFTLVIAGNQSDDKPILSPEIEKRMGLLQLSGKKAKEAISELAGDTGLSKKELYQTWIKLK
jgi:16S rRNA (cytidine1402-2'-O)-methyltransferase